MLNTPNVAARTSSVSLSSFRRHSAKRAGHLDAGPVTGGMGISSLRASAGMLSGGTTGGVLSRTADALAQASSRRVPFLDLPAHGGQKATQLGTPVRRVSLLTTAFARASAREGMQPKSNGPLSQVHEQSRRHLVGVDGRVRLLQRTHRISERVPATMARPGDRVSLFG